MTTSDDIPPLPEDWQRALAVVAHPDDLEFGASAAITRWVGQGRQVAELLVTRGEAGIDTIAPQECGPLRTAEQLAAARVVGVEEVAFLDFPDGSLQYGLDLRRELARAIRRHRPEVLISLNFRETFPGSAAFNHADHRALGPALLDAVRDAANRWMFPDLSDEGLRPWSGVRFAAFSGSPRATHHVPLSEGELAAGIASLATHRAYLSALGGFDHEAFLTAEARSAGESCGTGLATLFEVIPT